MMVLGLYKKRKKRRKASTLSHHVVPSAILLWRRRPHQMLSLLAPSIIVDRVYFYFLEVTHGMCVFLYSTNTLFEELYNSACWPCV
jgi:hypothetical protein